MVHNVTSMGRLVHKGMREYGIALHGTGETIAEAKEDIKRGYKFPQTLYMSCGYRREVKNPDTIPAKDVPCPCGNPDHWLVKYDLTRQPAFRRVLNRIRALRLFS